MIERRVLAPGPDHPIIFAPNRAPASVHAHGAVIAQGEALKVDQANYAPVYYFERSALTEAHLEASAKRTWCPYKGDATHFDLVLADGHRLENAVWSYDTPHKEVAAIAGLIAFYPSAIDGAELN